MTMGLSKMGEAVEMRQPVKRKCTVSIQFDSLTYWAEEFGVDGFRFDLMGLHDVATMKCYSFSHG